MIGFRKLLWLAVLVASSCGNDSNSPSADTACADLAQARCAKRMECTGGAGITRTFGDMNTCLTREKLSCTIGLAAPMTGNSPAMVEGCVLTYASLSCTDFLDNNPAAACIPTGPKPAGAPCAFQGQCASTYCSNNKTSVCGTCGAAPMVGASCATTSCARGQDCVADTQLCQLPGVSGAQCNGRDLPCGPDLGCVGATQTMNGTCMASSAMAGTPCGGTTGTTCDGTKGLFCGGQTMAKTCMTIPYVGDGMPCGTISPGMFAGCSNGGNCYTPAGTLAAAGESGTCKAAAADGQPCDTASGPPCMTPARCVVSGSGTAGTCVVPNGSMCM